MGLAISVGMLAELSDLDPEGVEFYRDYFVAVNDLLAKQGLPPHTEPETLPEMDNRCSLCSYPYSFLHYLRYAYAHRIADSKWVASPLPEGANPAADPVVEEQTMQMRSHLLCHSDAEGFYLPIEFREVLFDESERIPGGMVGSSYRLLEELAFVAPVLGIRLQGSSLPDEEAQAINDKVERQEGLWIERIVWLSLFEAARLSIKHKAAVCFA